MNIKNYEEVVRQLRAFLPNYLQDNGIDTSAVFRCISPSHDDKNPSCGVVPSKDKFHCFSCGAVGDIFDAHHMLENKPLSGPGFISDNLVPLAQKYGVTVETVPLTPEQLYELDTYRIYKAAADIILHSKTKQFQKVLKERKWSEETCARYGVGCLESYQSFREQLKKLGWSASFQDDVDLNRSGLFGEDSLIFTIKDEHGRPVGFAARNLKFNGDKSNGSKYNNQKTTGVKCNIYRKSERLFGFDQVLANRRKREKTIYIFEGQTDVLTAAENGLNNTVAACGTALTLEHVQMLKQYGYYDVILCLDGDKAGQDRTAALLDSVLAGHKDLSVRIINIPGNQDPDEFIKENGVAQFKKLKKWSAFEWRLNHFDKEAEDDEVCKAMIPLIVNETSYIEQEKQCKILAKTTGITMSTIQAEVMRLQNAREAEKARDRKNIIDKMITSIQREPMAAEAAMHNAEAELFDLARQYDEDSFSEDSTLAVLDTQKKYEEEKDGSFSGFILGPDLQTLQDALCGEWKKDVWFCFAGKANTGKTSLMCKLGYEIASHEENDALVIYHSIDDTAEQIFPRLVAVAEGSRKLTLNQIIDPNYHATNIANELERKQLFERRETGYSVIRDLIRRGRLVVKDANNGTSLAYADRLIRYYKKKYPGRNIVYILDNFHKSSDSTRLSKMDARMQFKTMSSEIKNVATKNHCLVIATVQYRKVKQGDRAGNDDIAESVQIEFDANFLGHLFNEVHEHGEDAGITHIEMVDGKPVPLPVIEMNIGKNKITAFKNRLFFNFWPESSDFCCTDSSKIQSDRQLKLEDLHDKYRKIVEEEVLPRGHSLGRAMYIFKERFNVDPPYEWRKEFE